MDEALKKQFLDGLIDKAPAGYLIKCSGCAECEKYGHLPLNDNVQSWKNNIANIARFRKGKV